MILVLIVLLAAIVAVAAANWWSRWTDDDRLELWTKPLATVLVIVLAAVGTTDDRSTSVVVLTVVALVLCLAGDVALMPQVDSFIAGLAAFLIGHLVFIAALVAAGIDAPWLAAVGVLLVVAVVGVAGRRIVASARASEPALVGPVLAYLTVISTMAVVAWGTGEPAAIIGATSFVVSDSILGWRKFVGEARWMSVAVMVTYHVALVGLAIA